MTQYSHLLIFNKHLKTLKTTAALKYKKMNELEVYRAYKK